MKEMMGDEDVDELLLFEVEDRWLVPVGMADDEGNE